MMAVRSAYKLLLRAPSIRGRHRLDTLFRRMLASAPDRTSEDLYMYLDPQEWIQITMLSGRPYEPETSRLIRRLLGPGDTFVDVGAHVGWFALIAARCVGKSGRVVAVDPQPYNCERLMNNAMANGFENIVVVPVAASDIDNFAIVRQQGARDKARFSLDGRGVNDTIVRFYCPTIRLDTLLRQLEIDEANIVKIDVEGLEASVLRGAESILRRVRNIVLEVLPETPNQNTKEVIEILTAAGFHIQQVDGSSWNIGSSAIEGNVWCCRRSSGAPSN